MTQEKNQAKGRTRRTEAKDLPKREKELSKDEQKKVKGGKETLAVIPSRTDNSDPRL